VLGLVKPLLLQQVTHLVQVVTQVLHVAQRADNVSFHGRVEVVSTALWAELGQASINVELGFVVPVEADTMFDQELFQVSKFALAGIVVVELEHVGAVDIGTDLQ
jgi:hypothetical protein